MKDLFILVGGIAIWVLVAKYLSRRFINKGRKAWLSNSYGVCLGAIAALVFLMVVVPNSEKKTQEGVTNTADAGESLDGKHAGSQSQNGCLEVYKPDGTSDRKCEGRNLPAPAPPPQAETNLPEKAHIFFDLTPQEFAKRMNANLNKLDSPFRLKISIKTGEVNNTFNHAFNENLAIVGTVDKLSGKVSAVTLITNGDGTAKSGMDVMAIVISAFSATMGKDTMKSGQPANIMMKLMEKNKTNTASNAAVSTILNGIKFSFLSSDTIGNWFTAEPA